MTDTLETLLQHRFGDREILLQALTHSSLSRDRQSYERLEFLGDRVLGFVIADMLFHAFPNEKEGALAKRHSMLVKQGALEKIAAILNLENHMHYARREDGHKPSPSMLADVVESLIAALYLDGGFTAADRFIRHYWTGLLHENAGPPEDAKSALQEWAQSKGIALPSYRLVKRSGPDHKPDFTVEVSLSGYPPQQATSQSKQAAQKLAARQLLDLVRKQENAV